MLLDFDVDTSKPTGRLVAHVLAAVAEFERQRIRSGQGRPSPRSRRGKRLGRPQSLPTSLIKRISRERERGHSYRAIAERLNTDQVPTAHGGRQWWPSTVRAVATSAQAS